MTGLTTSDDFGLSLDTWPDCVKVLFRGKAVALIKEERGACDAVFRVRPINNIFTRNGWMLSDKVDLGDGKTFFYSFWSFFHALEAIKRTLPEYLKSKFEELES